MIDGAIEARPAPSLGPAFAASALRGAPAEFHKYVDTLNLVLARCWHLFSYSDDLTVTTGLLGRAENRAHQIRSASITALNLLGVRLTTLLVDFVEALEGRRLLSAALAARAAIETAAAGAYLADKLNATLALSDDKRPDVILSEIRRSIFGSRFPWAQVIGNDDGAFHEVRLAFAAGKQRDHADPLASVNVLTLIKALDRRCPGSDGRAGFVQMVYEHLCEFVHPSAGTTVAFLRPAALPGSTRVAADAGPRALGMFWCMMGFAVAPLSEHGITAAMESLTSLCETYSEQRHDGSK